MKLAQSLKIIMSISLAYPELKLMVAPQAHGPEKAACPSPGHHGWPPVPVMRKDLLLVYNL